MAITEAYSGSATISTTEISLVSGTSVLQSATDDGVYQVWLDMNALTNTETYELKIKEKVRGASTQRTVFYAVIGYAQGNEPNFASPSLVLMHGWDVTLKKLGGTDRTVEWSIRKVA
jgi:asparagine N-glycosylation enzyme membrane subunit Stt3